MAYLHKGEDLGGVSWEVFVASVNSLLTQGEKAVAWYVKSKFIGRWGKGTVFIPGCETQILTYLPMGP